MKIRIEDGTPADFRARLEAVLQHPVGVAT